MRGPLRISALRSACCAALALSALAPALLPAQSGSDRRLEGRSLVRFEKTKGRSQLGRDVHWVIPAKVFDRALHTRRGWAHFEHAGIRMRIGRRAADLALVRQHQGLVNLRGRVFRRRLPKAAKKNEPPCIIVIRELRARTLPKSTTTPPDLRGAPRRAPCAAQPSPLTIGSTHESRGRLFPKEGATPEFVVEG